MNKARQKQKETIKQFGLDKDDIENIFDILEKENNLWESAHGTVLRATKLVKAQIVEFG